VAEVLPVLPAGAPVKADLSDGEDVIRIRGRRGLSGLPLGAIVLLGGAADVARGCMKAAAVGDCCDRPDASFWLWHRRPAGALCLIRDA